MPSHPTIVCERSGADALTGAAPRDVNAKRQSLHDAVLVFDNTKPGALSTRAGSLARFGKREMCGSGGRSAGVSPTQKIGQNVRKNKPYVYSVQYVFSAKMYKVYSVQYVNVFKGRPSNTSGTRTFHCALDWQHSKKVWRQVDKCTNCKVIRIVCWCGVPPPGHRETSHAPRRDPPITEL